MTQDNRNYLSINRSAHYYDIMRTTVFAFVGIAAIIEFGPDGYSPALTMLVIVTAVYGIIAGGTAIDDIGSLRDDMDEETANTHFGKSLMARNLPALKMISAVLLGLAAVAELYEIFT
ncbi:hypothetical protein OEG84_17805 [Hoeflea sp. G2-23]|uniref:Uncharacterized protein n=1 Tax=Hoeflea algicola TaxID=2983763 RepID=A0ABT3ZE42_9HYPH|nr:hypothetical protein [Hoeflea algicola]MCY0149511.1 hypothetical protein [Hoeflea algicola]